MDSKSRDCQTDFPVLGDSRSGHGHVCVSQQSSPTSVQASSSGATSTGGGCSVTRLAGEINVHVSADSSAQQDHSEITGHPSSRSDNVCSLVAITTVVPTPTSTLHGSPTVLAIPLGSTVSAEPGIHLGRNVVPSARMEALMQHYKADWATRDGFDPINLSAAQIAAFLHSLFDTRGLSPQTVKGYRTCLGSGLNRTGKASVVQHKTISDMIASMELQRPRITPVLPQWDLGIVLDA